MKKLPNARVAAAGTIQSEIVNDADLSVLQADPHIFYTQKARTA